MPRQTLKRRPDGRYVCKYPGVCFPKNLTSSPTSRFINAAQAFHPCGAFVI